MYRVVLIDDEAVILEGLKRVVKWENYDCQVVGTAFDAKSGNDLIRQEKPDILFTDIRMPGLKIGQIGEMVGYADAAHFTRTFKKLEGINANEYRNRMRNMS